MSRVYFHTSTRTASIPGSERGQLRVIATNTAQGWWGLDVVDALDRAVDIASLIPNVPSWRHIIDTAKSARAIRDVARETTARSKAVRAVHYNPSVAEALVRMLRTALVVDNIPLIVGKHTVWSMNVEFNTALAIGNEYVCLAAKIHGWCEIHPWIGEDDRAWCADVIEDAVNDGVYRKSLIHQTAEGDLEESEQGWDDVVALLRDTTNHPGEVVLSFSVCESFPNAYVSTRMPPWPAGVPEDHEALTKAQRQERQDAKAAWYALSPGEQWRTAMDGLRATDPWLNITETNLGTTTFGPAITLFDLFSHDRFERVKAACTKDADESVDG